MVIVNVDLQPDFFPGGALGAPGADRIIEGVNILNEKVRRGGGRIIFTKEDHPADMTAHFEKYGPHCIKDSHGAAIDQRIRVEKNDAIFVKGTEKDGDYLTSINAKDSAGVKLGEFLSSLGSGVQVGVLGLLKDYCAGDTAMDISRLGIDTILFDDLTPALNLKPDDGDRALERLRGNRVRILDSKVLKEME